MAVYGTGSAFQWWASVPPVVDNGTVTTVGHSTVSGGVRFWRYWDTVSIMGYSYCHYWVQLSILGYGTTILCNGTVMAGYDARNGG